MSEALPDEARIVAKVETIITERCNGLDRNDVRELAVEVTALVEAETLARARAAEATGNRVERVRAKSWKHFIPAGFLLVAWYAAWLLLFGLDRRTWATASEIALAATAALAAVVWIWSWLERSFGG